MALIGEFIGAIAPRYSTSLFKGQVYTGKQVLAVQASVPRQSGSTQSISRLHRHPDHLHSPFLCRGENQCPKVITVTCPSPSLSCPSSQVQNTTECLHTGSRNRCAVPIGCRCHPHTPRRIPPHSDSPDPRILQLRLHRCQRIGAILNQSTRRSTIRVFTVRDSILIVIDSIGAILRLLYGGEFRHNGIETVQPVPVVVYTIVAIALVRWKWAGWVASVFSRPRPRNQTSLFAKVRVLDSF